MSMTLAEAADRVGTKVVYRAPHVPITEPGEEGVITSVNSSVVFVRYGAQAIGVATPADCLTPIS